MIPIPAINLVDFGINNKASSISATPDKILTSLAQLKKYGGIIGK